MAAQNGMGAGNAAAYGNANNMPSILPGHYSDMQVMMDNMEKLSETLRRNREDWLQVQEGLSRVERLQVCVHHTHFDFIDAFCDRLLIDMF